jgi:hypothetical protein
MAGLDPAIHVLTVAGKAWMPGTSPGMTGEVLSLSWYKANGAKTIDPEAY